MGRKGRRPPNPVNRVSSGKPVPAPVPEGSSHEHHTSLESLVLKGLTTRFGQLLGGLIMVMIVWVFLHTEALAEVWRWVFPPPSPFVGVLPLTEMKPAGAWKMNRIDWLDARLLPGEGIHWDSPPRTFIGGLRAGFALAAAEGPTQVAMRLDQEGGGYLRILLALNEFGKHGRKLVTAEQCPKAPLACSALWPSASVSLGDFGDNFERVKPPDFLISEVEYLGSQLNVSVILSQSLRKRRLADRPDTFQGRRISYEFSLSSAKPAVRRLQFENSAAGSFSSIQLREVRLFAPEKEPSGPSRNLVEVSGRLIGVADDRSSVVSAEIQNSEGAMRAVDTVQSAAGGAFKLVVPKGQTIWVYAEHLDSAGLKTGACAIDTVDATTADDVRWLQPPTGPLPYAKVSPASECEAHTLVLRR